MIPEHGDWVRFVHSSSVWYRVKFNHAGVVVCDRWLEETASEQAGGEVLLAWREDAVVDVREAGTWRL